jgi:hypothetical protein
VYLGTPNSICTLKNLSPFMCVSSNWNKFVMKHLVKPMFAGVTQLGLLAEHRVTEAALLCLAEYFATELQEHPDGRHAIDWLSLQPIDGVLKRAAGLNLDYVVTSSMV